MQSSSTNQVSCGAKTERRYSFSRYFALFAALIFCIYQYGISRIYGFCVYPDEFGYWASAAQLVGYDWSDVASLGSYYSFGYSLILAPVLWIFRDGVMAYRAAVTVNMLLQCVSIGLLWGIFKRLYVKETRVIFAIGVAVFYPAWTFYMQMTMAEAFLAFLYVFICYQFVLLLEKPRMISVVLLSLSFVYIYYVHMRTLGVAVAVMLILFLYARKEPAYRRLLIIVIVVALAGVGIGFWIKDRMISTVYATADDSLLAVNDYAGQMETIKWLFNIQGLWKLFLSCIGKLYYLEIASFGLFFTTIGVCVRKILEIRKAFHSWKNWFYFFVLLSMLGQVLISAIFMSNPGRLDQIIYGRYNEYLLPVYIGIGVTALFEDRHPVRNYLINAGILTVLFGITFWTALHSGLDLMLGFFSTGLNYLSNNMYPYQVAPEFVKAYLFGLLLMAAVTGCVCISRRLDRGIFMVIAIVMVEILLTFSLDRKYIWHYNDMNYNDLKVYEYIEEYIEETGVEDTEVSYLHGGGIVHIDLIQLALQDKTVSVIYEPETSDGMELWEELEKKLPDGGFLIADADGRYLAELEQRYGKCMESSNLILFWIE